MFGILDMPLLMYCKTKEISPQIIGVEASAYRFKKIIDIHFVFIVFLSQIRRSNESSHIDYVVRIPSIDFWLRAWLEIKPLEISPALETITLKTHPDRLSH